jgi:hypothetical protein
MARQVLVNDGGKFRDMHKALAAGPVTAVTVHRRFMLLQGWRAKIRIVTMFCVPGASAHLSQLLPLAYLESEVFQNGVLGSMSNQGASK